MSLSQMLLKSCLTLTLIIYIVSELYVTDSCSSLVSLSHFSRALTVTIVCQQCLQSPYQRQFGNIKISVSLVTMWKRLLCSWSCFSYSADLSRLCFREPWCIVGTVVQSAIVFHHLPHRTASSGASKRLWWFGFPLRLMLICALPRDKESTQAERFPSRQGSLELPLICLTGFCYCSWRGKVVCPQQGRICSVRFSKDNLVKLCILQFSSGHWKWLLAIQNYR